MTPGRRRRAALRLAGALEAGLPLLLAGLSVPRPGAAQGPARWTVDSVPTVSIGRVDGPPGYLLDNPLAGMVLSNGTIVVLNMTKRVFELRFYDPHGKYLRTASRWGEGPYEFRTLAAVQRLGPDSILVMDQGERFAVFGPHGEHVREGRLEIQGLSPISTTVRVDDHHLAVLRSTGSYRHPEGTLRHTLDVVLLDLDSRTTSRVGALPDRTGFFEPRRNGFLYYTSPFAPDGLIAGGDGLLWMGDSASDSILAYRPGVNGPVRTIHVGFPQVRVTGEDRAKLRDVFSHFSGDLGRRWARYAKHMDFPDAMPRSGGLKVDREGNVWVQEYEVPWKEGPQHWEVYSSRGRHIADVVVPASAIPACARRPTGPCYPFEGMFEIGDDYVLVPEGGPMDVRVVREFAIHKGG